MDGLDGVGDRTFRVNFSGDGAARLRERVKEKLKEFMGDYTDDTLVEYVIVLLRNGRRKEEAKKELNVFLGDDSDNFVAWLWDHLSSYLDLYVQSREAVPDEVVKTKPLSQVQIGRNNSQLEQLSDGFQSDSDHDREKSVNESKSRRNREWKGIVRDVADPPPLRSTEVDNFHSEEKTHRRPDRLKRSRSPRPPDQRKRKVHDERHERQPLKREVTSRPATDAPRRLLQFAVRDAVGTSRPSASRSEPMLKRLRSVVSTSSGDSAFNDRPQKMRSVAGVPHGMATAIKAAAESAEDVIKVRCSGNVFDRLGRSTVTSKDTNQSSMFRASTPENGDYEDFDQEPRVTTSQYLQGSEYEGQFDGNMTMADQETGLASDYASDNDGYDDVGITRHRVVDASQTATSGKKDDNSLMVQYSVAKDTGEGMRKARMKDQDAPASSVANASRKIVNISVNVNTWKPSHYKSPREVSEVDNRVAMQENEAAAGKPGVRLAKENSVGMPANDNEMVRADTQKEVQKSMPSVTSSYSTVRPSEDADCRTLFVSNVHFAATKDTISRHFNKFGEVLKVVIVTDATTGQPTGSAYIEFMRKEAAEHALSLNGTSFMSRILKVVRRTSSHHEAVPMLSWPHMPRASPFAARLARVPFPRAIPGAFRARLPIKAGPRSLQWKRDGPVTPTTPAGAAASNLQNAAANLGFPSPTGRNLQNAFANIGFPSPTGRNLTYVRTEQKPDGNTGPA